MGLPPFVGEALFVGEARRENKNAGEARRENKQKGVGPAKKNNFFFCFEDSKDYVRKARERESTLLTRAAKKRKRESDDKGRVGRCDRYD
jgi:hypothetical protein